MSGGAKGEKLKLWRERLRRYAKWELSVQAFCRQEGVSIPTFYHWRKKLAEGSRLGKPTRQGAFQPVRVTPSVPAVRVRLPGGAQLEVCSDNLDAVRVVVAELARASQPVEDRSC